MASASIAEPAMSSEMSGFASTTRMTAGQNRPVPWRLNRCTSGMRGRSILSPSSESTAGSTVSEPSMATATTSMVPTAIELKTTLPDNIRPAIATMTAMPDTRTAWPLVAAAMSMASRRVAPRARSSRVRRT